MEKDRFKQLLESTMGNVKPLITEDFSNQMTYGALEFVGSPEENIRLYIKKQLNEMRDYPLSHMDDYGNLSQKINGFKKYIN